LKTKIQDVLLFFHQTAYSVLDDFCYQIWDQTHWRTGSCSVGDETNSHVDVGSWS
jgi:hypothetical protein